MPSAVITPRWDQSWKKQRFTKTQHQDDFRSVFDKDEARIIHAYAFRRLQGKTQILDIGESDFFRTRLTHSLEVAQIGRGINFSLSYRFSDFKALLPPSSLISAICLAHDLGHPPFGHGGEFALNHSMLKHINAERAHQLDNLGFEGNAQTLRILSKLESYEEGFGLNPSRRLLLGILKYPAPYSQLWTKTLNDSRESTPYETIPPKCYYDIDQDVVDFIFEDISKEDKKAFCATLPGKEGKNAHRQTLFKSFDCTIMDTADDIAYGVHDLEDGIAVGLITREDWEGNFERPENKALFEMLGEASVNHYDRITQALFGTVYTRKHAIGELVHFFISHTEVVENHSGAEDPLLRFKVQISPEAQILLKTTYRLVDRLMIRHPHVEQIEYKGQRLITELFDALISDPERFIAPRHLVHYEESLKARFICDFIASLTDESCTQFYERMFLPRAGSVFDRT